MCWYNNKHLLFNLHCMNIKVMSRSIRQFSLHETTFLYFAYLMNIVITPFSECYKPLWGCGPHVTGIIIILPLWLTFDKCASWHCMTLTQSSFSMSRLIHQLLTHSTPVSPSPNSLPFSSETLGKLQY